MNYCRSTISDLLMGFTCDINIIPNHLKLLDYAPPRHLSRMLSYLRQKRTLWRGDMWLPMDSSLCVSGWGSWWWPFKVWNMIIFGAAEKLIPLRQPPTASIISCLIHAPRKLWGHLPSLTKPHWHTRTPFDRWGKWLICGITEHNFFTQIYILFRWVND